MRQGHRHRLNTTHRRIAIAVVIVMTGLISWNCEKSGSNDGGEQAQVKERPVYHVPAELDRELNPFELDTLRSIKVRYGITRDEYWDDHGGVVANDRFEVWYPDGMVNVLQGTAYLERAELARKKTEELFGRAPTDRLVIVCYGDLEVFRYATGRDWWNYSKIVGDTMSVQSAVDIANRGLLNIVGPRVYYEWAIDKLSEGKCPYWLQSGLASYLSDEAIILESYLTEITREGPVVLKPDQVEKILGEQKDRIQTRRASYNAYRMVEDVVREYKLPKVAEFVNALPAAHDLDEASREVFGVTYGNLLDDATAWTKLEAQ